MIKQIPFSIVTYNFNQTEYFTHIIYLATTLSPQLPQKASPALTTL